ncbi:N-acetylneuraminate synthase [Rhizobium sp. CRIBSB]|nr:N-acetylneuraminate synthase [Rhizobium sp. CRIBSB]
MTRVLIIAEAGVNHDGSLDDALTMIDVAAAAGADVVKFQTFRAEALVTTRAAKAAYQVANTGHDGGQMAMLKQLELGADDHDVLLQRCRARGIRFMSTAFDMDSLDLLAGLDMPAIKIPSGDLTWGSMLLKAARVGPPLIVSTGMATLEEVRQALAVIAFAISRPGQPSSWADVEAAWGDPSARAALAQKVTLLHCTTQYPAPPEAVNLRAMTTMAEAFDLPVGYSDHTLGTAVSIAAVARGAVVIEKHFTLDRQRPGPDHAASLEPDELTAMIAAIRTVQTALGSSVKAPTPAEAGNIAIARRGLVASRPIAAGEVLVADMLTAKRPADGVSPMRIWDLVGTSARGPLAPDEAILP